MTAKTISHLFKYGVLGAISLAFLYVVWGFYMAHQPLFAVITFAVGAAIVILWGWARFYSIRFVFPAIAGIALFIVLPVAYTSGIGFTNYSATNILNLERVQAYHLSARVTDAATKRGFGITADGRLYFAATDDAPALITGPVDGAVDLQLTAEITTDDIETEPMRAVMQRRDLLQQLVVTTPDGAALTMEGLRSFAASQALYALGADDVLTALDGSQLTPNHETGFYEDDTGATVTPGWRVGIGWANFQRVVFSPDVREPIGQIFLWTVVFAGLSMFLTFGVGTLFAVLLNWQHLAFRNLYRVLLLLPYAVPSFISILVFRGLFNQNFGEINLILDAIFAIKPAWFTVPALAKTMLVAVNVWLGFPYWVLLVGGFLQSVPRDHYKAAALEGAGPVRSFFSITLPQILPPSIPLLIANFAFNFNNIVIVLLLTQGGPDIPGTVIQAGTTDILGSFTFRLAFQDSGQDFGLAGAISTLIFIITGIIAYVNFRLMQRLAKKRSARP